MLVAPESLSAHDLREALEELADRLMVDVHLCSTDEPQASERAPAKASPTAAPPAGGPLNSPGAHSSRAASQPAGTVRSNWGKSSSPR